jgi:uncharacterized protein (DUF302 family)
VNAYVLMKQDLCTMDIQHQAIAIGHNFEDYTYNLEKMLGLFTPMESDPASMAGFLENLGGGEQLVLFNIFEHGELLRLKGVPAKAKQYLIGNPLIALKMTRLDIRAGLYAPLRMLVYENKSGSVVVEYDLPSSLFAQLQHEEINTVALSLDAKLLHLIKTADQAS